MRRCVLFTLIKKFWNDPFRKRQPVAFLKWTDPFWEREVFIYNMIRFRSAMKPTFLKKKYYISLPKRLFSLPIWATNHIANKNFSFPKRIGPFQKGQLIAFSEMERFRIFFYSVLLHVSPDRQNKHGIFNQARLKE